MRPFSSDSSGKKIAIYAGSFDPPSSGHLDIIKRALQICDKLIVGIGTNPAKKPIFSFEERRDLLRKIVCPTSDSIYKCKVKVKRVDGLLADFITDNNIDFQVRGIRSYADFDSEFTMGLVNRELCDKETVFLLADAKRVHISSSRIRELAMFNRKLDDFVLKEIEDEVYQRLFEHYKEYPTFGLKDHGENNIKK